MQQHAAVFGERQSVVLKGRGVLCRTCSISLVWEQNTEVNKAVLKEWGVTAGERWSRSCIKRHTNDCSARYAVATASPKIHLSKVGLLCVMDEDVLCVMDGDFTGSTGCSRPPCKESRTLSNCQVPLVLSFILAVVFWPLGSGCVELSPFSTPQLSPLSPALPPSQSRLVFTILNQHRLWMSISKSLHCTSGCFGSFFKYFLYLWLLGLPCS